MGKQQPNDIDTKWNGENMKDKLKCEGYERPKNPGKSSSYSLYSKWQGVNVKADKRPLKMKKRSV